MKTRLSKAFDKKIELYEASEDVNNDVVFTKLKDVWARVMDINYENYDVIGQSSNLYDKKVICREKNLDSNTNAFAINGKLHQINRVETNYRQNQFTYFVNASDFETTKTANSLIINGKALILYTNKAILI